MAYNPATDFLGLWRASGGNVAKLEMPVLDVIVAALARAGVINVTVSATAPVANQSTTAWLKAAVPSYSAEGALFLWDKVTTAYLAATPALFLQFLEATAGENGVSWWTSTGGAPLNTVGNNGDFAIRTDTPNGIYGPKAAGAWPASPIPGTADVVTSASLDNTFGTAPGDLIYRGAMLWAALAIGAPNNMLVSVGGLPAWAGLSALMDTVFGNTQGSILYRDAGVWNDLGPGTAGQVLASGGPAANPLWSPRTAEFPSGTVMIFQQTAAPTGWVKQTALNDYGLRVTNGAVGTVAGSPFSTVFAQSAVAGHALSIAEMPAHTHGYQLPINGPQKPNSGGTAPLDGFVSANTDPIGGGGTHTHSVNLTLSYTDVIIAAKS